jgi:hypothetical protein
VLEVGQEGGKGVGRRRDGDLPKEFGDGHRGDGVGAEKAGCMLSGVVAREGFGRDKQDDGLLFIASFCGDHEKGMVCRGLDPMWMEACLGVQSCQGVPARLAPVPLEVLVQPEEGAQEFESVIDVMVEEAVRGSLFWCSLRRGHRSLNLSLT